MKCVVLDCNKDSANKSFKKSFWIFHPYELLKKEKLFVGVINFYSLILRI